MESMFIPDTVKRSGGFCNGNLWMSSTFIILVINLMPSVKQDRINTNKNVNMLCSFYSQDYPAIKAGQGSHRHCAIHKTTRQIQLLCGNIP